jgi:glycosyltransferase involved in cell wall biosynthesis
VIPPFIPPRESPDERKIPSRVRDFCKGKFPILAANGGFVKIDNKDVYGLFALTKLAKSLIDKFPNYAIVVYIRSGVDIVTEEFKCLLDETNNVPLKDHFLFFTSEGEFYPFLSICDIFLRPTSTDGDSNSVREALRCNIPVVASDVVPRPVGCRIYPFEKEEEFVKLVTQVAENIDAEKKRLTDIPLSNAADLLIEKYYQLLSH